MERDGIHGKGRLLRWALRMVVGVIAGSDIYSRLSGYRLQN